MTNLDSILKSRVITLSTNVHLVKAVIFPLVLVSMNCFISEKLSYANSGFDEHAI